MGLLDFARDVGRQLFDTDAEAADNIKNHLEVKTHGLSNLDVKFDDGVVTLCGDCKNETVRDQAILIAGILFGAVHFAEGPVGIFSNGAFGVLFGHESGTSDHGARAMVGPKVARGPLLG